MRFALSIDCGVSDKCICVIPGQGPIDGRYRSDTRPVGQLGLQEHRQGMDGRLYLNHSNLFLLESAGRVAHCVSDKGPQRDGRDASMIAICADRRRAVQRRIHESVTTGGYRLPYSQWLQPKGARISLSVRKCE